jgi:actin-like ATPase involved in cell morphogenesis
LGYGLGVDIGTSSISVAVLQDGQTRALTLSDDNGEQLRPRVAADTGPAATVQALTDTLRSILDGVVGQLDEWPETLVLTCQPRQGRYGRDLMDKAARQAGLDQFTVISDLEAAAAHYAHRERLVEGDEIAVYELGASAFSVAVARLTSAGITIGPVGTVKGVSGDDFDRLIAADVDRQLDGAVSALNVDEPVGSRAVDRLGHECEHAKIQLSEHENAIVQVLLPYSPARSSTRVRQSEVQLTRSAFEAMIVTALEATAEATHRALQSAQVTPEQLAGVLVIGGSARIPLVSAVLSTSLGRSVHVDPEAVEGVALGAALISGAVEPLTVGEATTLLAGPASTAPDEFSRPVTPWPARLSQGLVHRRRTVIAVAAALVLFIGASYLALDPGSKIRSGGPAAELAEPSERADPSREPTGSAKQTTTGAATDGTETSTDRTRAGSTDAASDPTRTGSDPTTIAPSSGTGTQSPVTTSPSGATPSGTGSATPSVSPSPGLVVRIGPLCYDVSVPDQFGNFPVVPCP